MKRLLLLTFVFGAITISATAQTAATQPASTTTPAKSKVAELRKKLQEDVMKTFSLTEAEATKAISIKEVGASIMNNPNSFKKRTEKGIQTDYAAIEEYKAKELAQINDIVKDEAKAKKLSQYIENRLPNPASMGARPR